MAGSGAVKHTYGPYGEILSPPLVGGIHPDRMLRAMMGAKTFAAIPVAERELFYGGAAIYAHQKQMEKVFSGQTDGIEGGAELYHAVLNGVRISLRPLGYEDEWYATFAPVLSRLPDGRWRVGVPGYGKTAILDEPDSLKAYLQARALYVVWAEADGAEEPVAI